MSETFLISDMHFGHENILSFKDFEGNPLRPFSSVEEMDETLVNNWNRVVGDRDKVYVLGDVAIKKKNISTIGRCNGKKVLIRGNHDIFKLKDYTPYFYDVRGSHKLSTCILTHIPVHPCQFNRKSFTHNIHGHLHSNRVMLDDGVDERYFSVCVEQINYTPISWEDIKIILGTV